MAAVTLLANSRFMHIGMALYTFCFCFGKDQCRMTKFAISFCMLTN